MLWKLETNGKGLLPLGRTAACFGQFCQEFRWPFSGSPRQVPSVGSRPDTGGTLGYRPSYLPFVCCSTLQKGAGLSHLRLEWQHMWCLLSSSCLPPTEQRGSKDLAGRRGVAFPFSGTRNSSFAFHSLA